MAGNDVTSDRILRIFLCFQITKVHEYLIFAVFFPFNAECNACPEKILLFRMILTLQVTRRKYVTDILDVINGSESEFDELSSSDEDEDVWLDSHLPNVGVMAADNDVSSDSDGDVDDDDAHSLTADITPARGQQKLRPQVKKIYKFDKRRSFIPPANTDYVHVKLEPEPIEGVTPYEYFKRFVNDDMFVNLATESNNYAHQKSGISLQSIAHELEIFTGMPAVSQNAGCWMFLGDRHSLCTSGRHDVQKSISKTNFIFAHQR